MPFVAAIALAASACQSDETDDQDELQALLHDEALTTALPSGATVSSTTAARTSGADGRVVPLTADPVGVWRFDDCTAARTQLADTSGHDNTAYRSVGVACADGIDATPGVKIANREDLVYVPDQPSFGLDHGVTVAAWFNPRSTSGTNTLFRKRDSGSSSFALLLNHDRYQFVVSLGHHAYSVSAPRRAATGAYQHVAATYDGTTLRLYLDGAQVASTTARGHIPPGPGPLLIGNDGSERRYDGAIDDALFATHALTAAEIASLNHKCHNVAPAVVVTPAFFVFPAPAGSATPIEIDVFNNTEDLACAPMVFELEASNPGTGLTIDPAPFTKLTSAPVPPQGSGHFTINVIPDDDLPRFTDFFVQFSIAEPSQKFFQTRSIQVFSDLPVECHVSTKRELMITDVSVVDDPIRNSFDPSSSDPRNGAWTFKRLMEDMAPTAAAAPDMVEHMLQSFVVPQLINTFPAVPRPNMKTLVLDRWPRTPDGKLDLAQAPLTLNGIVSRIDLRDLAKGDAGEGRFVFAFNDPDNAGFGLRATIILEYKLPAHSEAEVLEWANGFHALGALRFGEGYNAALQALTDRFAGRNARPGTPNGSAINAVRTNDVDFSTNEVWDLREFHLSETTGLLEPAATDLTPDLSFNNTPTLASYINANEPAILAEKHLLPLTFNGRPFAAATTFNELVSWFAPGVRNPEARHKFAVNTCNGCHSQQETNTRFLMMFPRFAGTETILSSFLTGGVTMHDPFTNNPRTFNELARRNQDLRSLVCTDAAPLSSSPSTIAKGSSRVH